VKSAAGPPARTVLLMQSTIPVCRLAHSVAAPLCSCSRTRAKSIGIVTTSASPAAAALVHSRRQGGGASASRRIAKLLRVEFVPMKGSFYFCWI